MFSDSNSLLNKIRYYSSFIMAAIYLVIGLLFLFSDTAINTFPNYRLQFSTALLVYGSFRLYSTIKKIKQK